MPALVTDRRAETAVPIDEILAMRWSPRSFDPEALITDEQITSLLEAARWAASASNTQPWRFIVGTRGGAVFERIHEHLMGFNQTWTPRASALVVGIAETTGAEGRALRWAEYDLGQAMANLAAQAHAIGLHVHPMGGIDVPGLQRAFALPEHLVPVTVTAVGTVAPADMLAEERHRARETAPRERLPLSTLVLAQD